jgi:hypothetical protein
VSFNHQFLNQFIIMKTIKGAAGSKSNLLRKLALPLLAIVALIGIEIGGGQTAPRDPSLNTPDIGGNSAPRTFVSTTDEIGGGQETRKSAIGPEIGGNSVPRHFAYEIGGNQSVPKSDNPLSGIGGSQTAPRSVAIALPIGDTNGTDRRNVTKPYSPPAIASGDIGGQNQQTPRDSNPLGIGGNSCPRCGMLTIAIEIPTIGGSQSPPRPIDIGGGQTPPRSVAAAEPIGGSNQNKPQEPNPLGIGGQIPPRSGGFYSSFLQDCTVNIGGTQGVPRLPFDIGGNGGSTAPRNYSLTFI